MSLQPKPEPGSPPGSTSTNPDNFEQKTIPDLVTVLRGTRQVENFDAVEVVLVNRDTRLRAEIQQLQKKFELEKLRLQEKLQIEVLLRIHAEEEFRKREELCAKEVGELENKVLELRKLNGKLVKSNNGFDELLNQVHVLEGDKNALVVGLKSQIAELEERVKNHLTTISELGDENRKLADENKLLSAMFRDLQVRVSRLEDDAKFWLNDNVSRLEDNAKLWLNDNASDGGNNEGEPWLNGDASGGGGNSEGGPPADPVTDFEDNGEEDDTLEVAPLPENEDAPHSLKSDSEKRLVSIFPSHIKIALFKYVRYFSPPRY